MDNIEGKEVEMLRPQKGDIVLVRISSDCDKDAFASVHKVFGEVLQKVGFSIDDIPVVVMNDTVSVRIIREEKEN